MRQPTSFVVAGLLLAAGSGLAEAPQKPAAARSKQADITLALSAAPAAVRAGAAVVDLDDKGQVAPLRAGDNGWTCLPRDPGTPDPRPVCLDANGLAWFEAAMSGTAPDPKIVGYAYMLKGGTAWSLTDGAATKLPQGEKTHATLPPHIMILNAKLANESGLPSGAHSDVHRPFVMYAGTPFALIIIPVE